jgi:hypothetical protein
MHIHTHTQTHTLKIFSKEKRLLENLCLGDNSGSKLIRKPPAHRTHKRPQKWANKAVDGNLGGIWVDMLKSQALAHFLYFLYKGRV